MKILSFDVGGTFIKWALFDEYEIIQKGKVETPQTSFEEYLNALKSVVDAFPNVEGLAFSLPGTIDKKTGYMVQGGSLHYNDNRYYVKEVEEFFHLPVSIENDSKSAAICEHEMGALKGIENGAVIVLGTGLGCTFVLNGQIYNGTHNAAGEISIVLAGDLFKEKFGAFWAEKCSTAAMVRMAQEELQVPALDGVSFMNLVAQGNPKANAVLDTCLEALAKGLFNIQIINDLDTIVIGGGISENPLYIQRLQEKLTSFYEVFPFPIPRANLVASKSGNDANLKGALINFYKEHK